MALTKASLIDLNGQELILDSDADTSITVDTDDQIDIKIGGTDVMQFSNSSSDFVFKNPTQDKDILFKGNDDGSEITALTLDMSSAGEATFNAGATFGSKVKVPTAFTVQSSVAANNTGDLKIIESANSTSGVGYAAPIIGSNIDDAVNGSNVPTQDNVWGGVSGASALSLSADMSADNATHMFWGSGASETAGTALTKLLSVSRNGGISFGTDTCNDANTLDDYEEGTWTPTFAGVACAAIYGSRYTKIGQLVMVEAYVAGDTQNNTDQFRIGGLPFTSHNVTAYGGGSIQYVYTQDYSEFTGPLIPGNSTYIYFHYITGAQGGASVTNNVLYNKVNGNQLFIFQAFYRTG